nr:CoA transferase [uncultured Cupriavidus sp.]
MQRKSFDPTARGPLHGLRIIDMSRLVAGNMLTLQLADFGADVIKIEPPDGDTLRNFKTDGLDIWWKTYSRNKRSVGLDLRNPDSIALIKELVSTADALVESFRPGTLEAMGLAPEVLHALNPRLVITRISGWGQTGPYRHKPGFGTLVEAYSGFAAINGFEDREPVLPPMFLGDMTTGLYGASATMMALRHVEVCGGRGQVLDLSLFEPMLSIMGPQAANFQFTRKLKRRTGSRSNTTAPRNVYQTQDNKWLALSTASNSVARRLMETIGHGHMLQDPRYATNSARLANIEEVDKVVGEYIRARSLDENMAIFEAAGVTVGPVYNAEQVLEDAYVAERESLVEVPDAELGALPMHNIVPRWSDTPGQFRLPAPSLGQHNDEIVREVLGVAALQRMQANGALVSGQRGEAVTSAPVSHAA